jgi:hypothetical protein
MRYNNLEKLLVIFLMINGLLFFNGCQSNQKRPFFLGMRNKYDNIPIDSGFYFLKSFGLSDSSATINNRAYWELYSDCKSFFFLKGFIRKLNDSIMFMPHGGQLLAFGNKEQKIFDFANKSDSTWTISFNNTSKYINGYRIKFRGTTLNKNRIEYNYLFQAYQIRGKSNYYKDRLFNVKVTKEDGIIQIDHIATDRGLVIYHCQLFPEQLFKTMHESLIRI